MSVLTVLSENFLVCQQGGGWGRMVVIMYPKILVVCGFAESRSAKCFSPPNVLCSIKSYISESLEKEHYTTSKLISVEWLYKSNRKI